MTQVGLEFSCETAQREIYIAAVSHCVDKEPPFAGGNGAGSYFLFLIKLFAAGGKTESATV